MQANVIVTFYNGKNISSPPIVMLEHDLVSITYKMHIIKINVYFPSCLLSNLYVHLFLKSVTWHQNHIWYFKLEDHSN
jgi:hypothetical protein